MQKDGGFTGRKTVMKRLDFMRRAQLLGALKVNPRVARHPALLRPLHQHGPRDGPINLVVAGPNPVTFFGIIPICVYGVHSSSNAAEITNAVKFRHIRFNFKSESLPLRRPRAKLPEAAFL